MRRILMASLLLSPMLFIAVASYGQNLPDTSALPSDPPVSNDATANLDVPANHADIPVSTGVTPPAIVEKADVPVPFELRDRIPTEAEVVVQLNVDETGKPHEVQVVKSLNPVVDMAVVEAVDQFRWNPAVLDNQPVAADVILTVVVDR